MNPQFVTKTEDVVRVLHTLDGQEVALVVGQLDNPTTGLLLQCIELEAAARVKALEDLKAKESPGGETPVPAA
jgi:hypothetical protein